MRARNIKPGFYRDADLAECSITARYIAPGLWMMADREGRLIDNPKQIKMELAPCDDIDMEAILEELAAVRHILRYEVNGIKVIQVRKFLEHQNPHKNETASQLPEPPQVLAPLREDSSNGASNPADSLNPDSLNPDSLNPDSLNPDKTHVGVYTPTSSSHGNSPQEDIPKPKMTPAQELKPPQNGTCPHEKILQLYHEILPELPKVRVWPETNQKILRARWKEDPERQELSWWQSYFEYVRGSPFLLGKEKDWMANLEWLVRPRNMTKVLNGSYHRQKHGGIKAWLNATGSDSPG